MTMPRAAEHAEISSQARGELDAGDSMQASEKAWGAAAHFLKSVAERRGWRHKTHGSLFAVANRMSARTGNPDFNELIRIGSALHKNFYENSMSQDDVRRGIYRVATLISALGDSLATDFS